MLYSHINNPIAGRTKSVQNYISASFPDGHTEVLFVPLSPFETPDDDVVGVMTLIVQLDVDEPITSTVQPAK